MERLEERRPAVRVVVDLQASWGAVGSPAWYPARVVEMSASGLRLRTGEPLRPGLINVAFDVDGRKRQARIELRVVGRVVRILREEPSSFEYALRLVDGQSIGKMRQAVLMISLGA
jgi:hypothetical protein